VSIIYQTIKLDAHNDNVRQVAQSINLCNLFNTFN